MSMLRPSPQYNLAAVRLDRSAVPSGRELRRSRPNILALLPQDQPFVVALAAASIPDLTAAVIAASACDRDWPAARFTN